MRVARKAGSPILPAAGSPSPLPDDTLNELANRLWGAQGRSLVLCGLADTSAQVLCNFLNHLLGNYGATLDLAAPSYQKQGDDRELAALMDEIKAGKVAALFVHGVNPVADLPGGEDFSKSLAAIPLLVSLSPRADETRLWRPSYARPLISGNMGRFRAVAGVAAISQPAIRHSARRGRRSRVLRDGPAPRFRPYLVKSFGRRASTRARTGRRTSRRSGRSLSRRFCARAAAAPCSKTFRPSGG